MRWSQGEGKSWNNSTSFYFSVNFPVSNIVSCINFVYTSGCTALAILVGVQPSQRITHTHKYLWICKWKFSQLFLGQMQAFFHEDSIACYILLLLRIELLYQTTSQLAGGGRERATPALRSQNQSSSFDKPISLGLFLEIAAPFAWIFKTNEGCMSDMQISAQEAEDWQS